MQTFGTMHIIKYPIPALNVERHEIRKFFLIECALCHKRKMTDLDAMRPPSQEYSHCSQNMSTPHSQQTPHLRASAPSATLILLSTAYQTNSPSLCRPPHDHHQRTDEIIPAPVVHTKVCGQFVKNSNPYIHNDIRFPQTSRTS